MAKLDANRMAEKHGRRMSQAGEDYRFGVQNPSRQWDEAMIANSERIINELIKALQDGRLQRGVQRAGHQKWADGAMNKGARRFTEASGEASDKYAQKAQQVVEAAEAGRRAAERLPNTTREDRFQRMIANAKAIADYWEGQKS